MNKTPEQLIAIVNNEGLSYAVQHYCGEILCLDDPKLESLWNTAFKSMKELDKYLNDKYSELYED